ncbi:MAG TPA: hypothetical protein VGE97_09415 [Nitrososphaera sp.]|jgi:hypothetical protein
MKAQAILRDGGTITVEGCDFVIDGDGRPTKKGDWYIAERNTGPKLLTVKCFCYYTSSNEDIEKTDDVRALHDPSWINPVESEYAYDYHECVKVKEV